MMLMVVIAVMVIDTDYCFVSYLMITIIYSRIIVCNKVIIVIEGEVVSVLNVLIIKVFIVVNANVNFIVEKSMLFSVLPLHIFFDVNFIVEHSTFFCVFPPQIFFYLLLQAQLPTSSIIHSSVWNQFSDSSVLKLKVSFMSARD